MHLILEPHAAFMVEKVHALALCRVCLGCVSCLPVLESEYIVCMQGEVCQVKYIIT